MKKFIFVSVISIVSSILFASFSSEIRKMITGKWKFVEMTNPNLNRVMNAALLKSSSLTDSLKSCTDSVKVKSFLQEKAEAETGIKMINDALEQMKSNGIVSFLPHKKFRIEIAGQTDNGTWQLDKTETHLITKGVNGVSDTLEILMLTPLKLTLGSAKDSILMSFEKVK